MPVSFLLICVLFIFCILLLYLFFKKKLDSQSHKLLWVETSFMEAKTLLRLKEDEIEKINDRLLEESKTRSRLEGLLEQQKEQQLKLKTAEEALLSEMKRGEELNSELAKVKAHLEEEKKLFSHKVQVLEEAKQQFETVFKSLSQDVLKQNSLSFLQLATAKFEKYDESLKHQQAQREQQFVNELNPFKESVGKFDSLLRDMEKTRHNVFNSLADQIKNLSEMQLKLGAETSKLANSLKSTQIRGRWGEIQLKRVVELAGMIEYCDFEEQVVVSKESGFIRPDIVVRLPNEKSIIVDAKAPLQAYLDAHETQNEEERQHHLKAHSKQVRSHIQHLSSKAYSEEIKESCEFVVLFLPGDPFFSAALQNDPGLIEFGVERKVLLATPTTLIAILRAVAFGWRQEKLALGAKEISLLGGELFDRLCVMVGHMDTLKRGLDAAVSGFNQTVSSLNSRVVPTAKKLIEKGAASKKEMPELIEIEKTPKDLERLHSLS